jgi:hypothetical protein
MRKFVIRILLFLTLAAIAYVSFTFLVFPRILKSVYGPSVEEQIDKSFQNAKERDYELLILGNSRLYCGVNPDQFNVKAYNFSHNNDSFNQMYYKLKWVLDNKQHLRYVIVGVDYFQFSIFSDTRNYVYAKYLGPGYMGDYRPYRHLYSYVRETLNPYKIRTLVKDPVFKHDLKDNGQFVRNGIPKEDDFIKRNFARLDIQVNYFEKILETCREENIIVFLCMPPIRDVELMQYSDEQLNDFDQFIKAYESDHVFYLDFSRDPRFEKHDFIDFAHLSQSSADKFSHIMSEMIEEKTQSIHMDNTYSKIDSQNRVALRNEK